MAIGGEDRLGLRSLWVDCLGLESVGVYRSEKENVDEEILRLGKDPFAVELDLMQPLDRDKKPRVDHPALNHVGLWVDDLPIAVRWLEGRGVRFAPGGIRPGASGHDVTFIHPKGSIEAPLSGAGVLIELVQAPPEVIAAHDATRSDS